ncbi:WRKY transcription factor 22-like [Olea europaea var. sylvestris]|uniref:WRKY transcription factor 22-like n=1 Tax=Olea europaea var. sylvestris TaxID=158386 RepID=UPI000C1D5BA4|nr:WRKY transcription factor 22-like [Olea europaea var. sylvestris]
MEDWGFQDIVTGSSGDFSNISNTDIDQKSFLGFSSLQQFDYEFVYDFPKIFEGDELEELYKSFCPTVANSGPAQTVLQFEEESPPGSTVIQEKKAQCFPSETSDSTTRATAHKPRYKRRKNEHKRRVVQVSVEGISSDVWAWRKYGQKPIKGSPYPRSYYRCSSSKECIARKQVEQSCTDPGMFNITYTAEHNHSQPTRRNSLAGTIRQKFPASRSPNRINIKLERTEDSISCSKLSAPFLSTETEALLPSSIEEDFLQAKCNQEGKEDDELIFSDDFFSWLEEFDGFNSDTLPISSHSSAQQFPLSSCS